MLSEFEILLRCDPVPVGQVSGANLSAPIYFRTLRSGIPENLFLRKSIKTRWRAESSRVELVIAKLGIGEAICLGIIPRLRRKLINRLV